MTTSEFAYEYVREHYENQAESISDVDLRALIDHEAPRLHRLLVLVCEAWAMNAELVEK